MLKQLNDHLHRNGLYKSYQSAYRHFHSCETASMKIYSDDLTSESFVITTSLIFNK